MKQEYKKIIDGMERREKLINFFWISLLLAIFIFGGYWVFDSSSKAKRSYIYGHVISITAYDVRGGSHSVCKVKLSNGEVIDAGCELAQIRRDGVKIMVTESDGVRHYRVIYGK